MKTEVKTIETMELEREDTERLCGMINKIFMVIEESKCTYEEALIVLDSVKTNYEKKGRNLLNGSSIQVVARYDSLIS